MEKEEENCSVCLTELTLDEVAMLGECPHKFHLACIREWSKKINTCPFCRARFETIEVKKFGEDGVEELITTEPVAHIEEQEDREEEDNGWMYVCRICQTETPGDDAHTIICDGCDGGYHLACLTPALTSVPQGIWLCLDCIGSERGRLILSTLCSSCGDFALLIDTWQCVDCHLVFHRECVESDHNDNEDWRCPSCIAVPPPLPTHHSPIPLFFPGDRYRNSTGRYILDDPIEIEPNRPTSRPPPGNPVRRQDSRNNASRRRRRAPGSRRSSRRRQNQNRNQQSNNGTIHAPVMPSLSIRGGNVEYEPSESEEDDISERGASPVQVAAPGLDLLDQIMQSQERALAPGQLFSQQDGRLVPNETLYREYFDAPGNLREQRDHRRLFLETLPTRPPPVFPSASPTNPVLMSDNTGNTWSNQATNAESSSSRQDGEDIRELQWSPPPPPVHERHSVPSSSRGSQVSIAQPEPKEESSSTSASLNFLSFPNHSNREEPSGSGGRSDRHRFSIEEIAAMCRPLFLEAFRSNSMTREVFKSSLRQCVKNGYRFNWDRDEILTNCRGSIAFHSIPNA